MCITPYGAVQLMKVKKSWSGLMLACVLGGCHVGVVHSEGSGETEGQRVSIRYTQLGIIPNVAKILSL